MQVAILGVATRAGQGMEDVYALAAAMFHQLINACASELTLRQLCIDCKCVSNAKSSDVSPRQWSSFDVLAAWGWCMTSMTKGNTYIAVHRSNGNKF